MQLITYNPVRIENSKFTQGWAAPPKRSEFYLKGYTYHLQAFLLAQNLSKIMLWTIFVMTRRTISNAYLMEGIVAPKEQIKIFVNSASALSE